MKNLYKKAQAHKLVDRYKSFPADLILQVYASRLLGANPKLVLHGGGNTSVKLKRLNALGQPEDIMYVKGSGADLANIDPHQFVPLCMDPLQKLSALEGLSDEQMDLQLQIHRAFPSPLSPSVEALLHAFLPHKYIDHTHAQSILILSHQPNGEDMLRQALGPKAAVLPYIRSGFPLAKAALNAYRAQPDLDAMVICDHGIVTFDQDGQRTYEKMRHYVSKAEAYIHRKTRAQFSFPARTDIDPLKDPTSAAARFSQTVRGLCAGPASGSCRRRFYVAFRKKNLLVRASLARQAPFLCESGVLTPDHIIRTKNRMVYVESIPGSDQDLKALAARKVKNYQKEYRRYFKEQTAGQGVRPKVGDPLPRLFLVAGLGLFALGATFKEAVMAADIGEQNLSAKLSALKIGAFRPISDDHIFDMEYWSFQQKKIDSSPPPPLQGQIALVTGAGGAIGCGVADRLLAAGAVVVLADIDASRLEKVHRVLTRRYGPFRSDRIVFDVTRYDQVHKAFDQISSRFGGMDILVPNAGIAHVARIEDLEPEMFQQVLAVNLSGIFTVIKAAIPIFKRQATGGNIIVISSKNVFDPGAAFSAYSASKAGAHQMGKIAAMELAELGVRVNMVNPDAVFGDQKISSRLWDLVGPDRMKSRGLDAEGLKAFYRQRSLLKVPVLAEHVGNAVVFFASNQTPTTGASLPIDGGIPAAFPR